MGTPIQPVIHTLPFLEIFSISASIVSVVLAIFAVWLAFQQRKESQNAYEKTKDVLSELEKVMKSTELLVSDNFQNLLQSITDQQGQMLDALKPKPNNDDIMTDLIVRLADEPDKLAKVTESFAKFQSLSVPS
jgi:hypothetical protein